MFFAAFVNVKVLECGKCPKARRERLSEDDLCLWCVEMLAISLWGIPEVRRDSWFTVRGAVCLAKGQAGPSAAVRI